MSAFPPHMVCHCDITDETAIWAVNIAYPLDVDSEVRHWYHGSCRKVGNPYTNVFYKNKLLMFPFPKCIMCDETYVVLKKNNETICFFCLEDMEE